MIKIPDSLAWFTNPEDDDLRAIFPDAQVRLLKTEINYLQLSASTAYRLFGFSPTVWGHAVWGGLSYVPSTTSSTVKFVDFAIYDSAGFLDDALGKAEVARKPSTSGCGKNKKNSHWAWRCPKEKFFEAVKDFSGAGSREKVRNKFRLGSSLSGSRRVLWRVCASGLPVRQSVCLCCSVLFCPFS